ncbi:MAG: prohibitin family protein [Campylobacterota bacterium]|nr:prohibitin family protein [Campylobacterota bacterium]
MRFISVMLTLLITALIVMALWHRVVITIHSGEAGVLFKRWSGTVIDKVYEEGFYIIPPWDIMTKYSLRVQEIKHTIPILSNQGLEIDVKLSIRYRPDATMLGVLHQRVGPDYVRRVIIPEIEAVVRKQFGQLNDEEIYTSKKAILETISNLATKELATKFIILDNLIVRKLKFPAKIMRSIQEKINQYHRFKEYEYKIAKERLEVDRKIIEANGIRRYIDIISKDLTPQYLSWKGIEATLNLAESKNSKLILIGSGKNGLPLILNTADMDKEIKNAK